ncbi:MAG: protein kinase [Clostridia bacterium]
MTALSLMDKDGRMDERPICLNCMDRKNSQAARCKSCGYLPNSQQLKNYCLPEGSLLKKKYLVGTLIGGGGFSNTYIACDMLSGKKVAMKEYMPSEHVTRSRTDILVYPKASSARDMVEEGKLRFLEEAKILASFKNNPGIVEVKDFFEENNTAYLVMEYLEGQSLADHLEENGRLSEKEALGILLNVTDILRTIHRKNFLHRDISPENIIITKNNEIKLIDFGASREFSIRENNTKTIMVKQGYTPPEQYSKKGNQGAWTDIYALAATFYKMLTGVTPPDSLDRLMGEELKELSFFDVRVSAKNREAIKKAMSINIGDRFQDIDAFENSLEAHGIESKSRVVLSKGKGFAGRNRILIAAFASVLLVTTLVFSNDFIIKQPDETAQVAQAPVAEENQETDEGLTNEVKPQMNAAIISVPDMMELEQEENKEVETTAEAMEDEPVLQDPIGIIPVAQAEIPNQTKVTGPVYINHQIDKDHVTLSVIITVTYPETSVIRQYRTRGGQWEQYSNPVVFFENDYMETRAVFGSGQIITGGVEITIPVFPNTDAAGSIIPDPYLNAIVRLAIKKPEGDILPEDLSRILVLEANSSLVRSIEGLQHCVALTHLNISGNPLTDLTPIAGLHSLRVLQAYEVEVMDFTPLAGLTGLKELYICNNPQLTDIGYLKDLVNLHVLNIESTAVSDISIVAGMEYLTRLHISHTLVRDIYMVENHGNLVWVSSGNNLVQDFTPFLRIKSLERLDVDNSKYELISRNPIWSGYVFDGWYVDESMSIPWDGQPQFGGQLRLYMRWRTSTAEREL